MSQDTLSLILKRADAPIEPVFKYDEARLWPEGDLELMVKLGLLREIAPAKSVECDGCEEACIEDVEIIDGPKEGQVRAYVVCRRRDDIGRIEVASERLRRWAFDQVRLAAHVKVLTNALGLMEEVIPERLWWLGDSHINNQRVGIFIAFGVTQPDARGLFRKAGRLKECALPLVLTISQVAGDFPLAIDGKMLSLLRLLSVHNGDLVLDTREIDKLYGKQRVRRTKASIRFPTPSGVIWEDLVIRFVSDKAVEITAGSYTTGKDYEEMGFANQGKTGGPPDILWEFLKLLAQREGFIGWEHDVGSHEGSRTKFKKWASDLRKRLKHYFGIDDDPFYPYRHVNGYKTKFVVTWNVSNHS